ncbi:glycoside hydrolase family 16 protein [Zasmidium cellare ATCC 36951]|uniref:Glycoside hydrolase family 16 protein n=1 Tax=Zasmidium cellare ATCC 36951 TaxID=1080233 RepID=A0A6A6CVU4_ZASCE|nr:glycoside hydrolase family 16 protein [Zasmidium cellare ATCC 36951]KAF2171307.1 glycoside hydrolase family 16 protein [Zasmidium cellare ATCC 36951]
MHSFVLLPFLALSTATAEYVLQSNFSGATFFDDFNFYDSWDPTFGFVHYVDRATAQAMGLIESSDTGPTIFGVDHTGVYDPGANLGRASVRLESFQQWTHGLFIADLAENTLHLWINVARNYSARQLTVQNDRLPALAGLASLYKAETGLDYLAGLWSGQHLFELLLWFRISETTSTRLESGYLAPSWSWIAMNGPVNFKRWVGPESYHRHIATFLNYFRTLKCSNPFGEITDGYLELSAPAITTTIAAIGAVNKHDPDSMSWRDGSVYLQQLFPEHIMEALLGPWAWPTFDLDQNNYAEDLIVHCLVLGYEWWGPEDYGMYGILVTPISATERTFRRIGMFDKLPKFRHSDQELDMMVYSAKRHETESKLKRFDRKDRGGEPLNIWSLERSLRTRNFPVSRPEYEDALRELNDLETESRERAQTMREDLEFQYFRIF